MKLSEIMPYAKPILVGTALNAGAGALAAPKGHEKEWAISGGIIGGIGSGPAQVGLKRLLSKGKTIKQLAKAEIKQQSFGEIAKWTAIGTGATAAITAATGGYSNPDNSSRAAQAADLGIDTAGILARSARII